MTALGEEEKEFKKLLFKDGVVVKVNANPKPLFLKEDEFQYGIAEVVGKSDRDGYSQLVDGLKFQKRNQFELIRETIESITSSLDKEKSQRILTWLDAWIHFMNMTDVMIGGAEEASRRRVFFKKEVIRLAERKEEFENSVKLLVKAIDELQESLGEEKGEND